MKKLSKAQFEQMNQFINDLRKQEADVNHSIAQANKMIGDANHAINELQSLIEDVQEWRDEIVSEIESYVDDRSEKWQEGEQGEKYSTWKEQFESLYTEDIPELEEIEEINVASDLASQMEETISSSIENI
jgi:conjugal transfer/entry exclusion protein